MSIHPTLYIVDDSQVAQETLQALLATELYHLIFFDEGKSLIAQGDTCELPDLVLLDVILPEIDGYEVCRTLRANKRWDKVSIILITALDDPVSRRKGFDAGADNVIPKPFNRLTLRAVIRSTLRTRSLPILPPEMCGDLP